MATISPHKASTSMVGDTFSQFVGPPESGFSLFLAERTKKLHFIRHAEGAHNAETEKTGSNDCLLQGDYTTPQQHPLWDAHLTAKGIAQAVELRDYLTHRPDSERCSTTFDLVVVSPLTRTCETALHIFGPGRKPGLPAFLNAELHGEQGPKILVREECRERWGKFVCDGRRPISEIIKDFPNFDFGEIEHNVDMFYSGEERESDDHCCARAIHFLEWLNKRPEQNIAIVTHSSFLRHLFGQFGKDKADIDSKNLVRTAGNCELRSVVMCSHGSKESVPVKRMQPTPASTVDIEYMRAAKKPRKADEIC